MKSIYYILIALMIISMLVVVGYYTRFIPFQIEGDIRNGKCTGQKTGSYEMFFGGEWKQYSFNCEQLNPVVPYCQEPVSSDKLPTCDDVCTNQYCGYGECQITANECYNECIVNREGREVKCYEDSCPFGWSDIGNYGCSGFPPCTKCCCLEIICECSDWVKKGCNVYPCAPGHMTYLRDCFPDQCSQEYRCDIDNTCPSGECESVPWIDPVECSPSQKQAGPKCHGDKIISCNLYEGPIYCWTLVEDCKSIDKVCVDYGTVENHNAKCTEGGFCLTDADCDDKDFCTIDKCEGILPRRCVYTLDTSNPLCNIPELPWNYILSGVFGIIGFIVPIVSVKKRKRTQGMIIGIILGAILGLICYWIFTYYINLNELIGGLI